MIIDLYPISELNINYKWKLFARLFICWFYWSNCLKWDNLCGWIIHFSLFKSHQCLGS